MELSCNDNSMESNTVKKLITNDSFVQGLSRPLVHVSVNDGVEIYTLHLVPPLTEVTLSTVVHLSDPLEHINSKPTAVVGHVTPCSPEPLVRLRAYRGQLLTLD